MYWGYLCLTTNLQTNTQLSHINKSYEFENMFKGYRKHELQILRRLFQTYLIKIFYTHR